MIRYGETADKMVFVAIYLTVMGIISWVGIGQINYSLDSRFYTDMLIRWENALQRYNVTNREWPIFAGDNHFDYMKQLAGLMKTRGASPPPSNTVHPFIYKINKIGSQAEKIFLLCFSNKIVMYGLPGDTFKRLDKFIDGTAGTTTGAFTFR